VLLVLFAGNCFGAYQLFSNSSSFLTKFPKLTETGYAWFRWLPVVNLIALAGPGSLADCYLQPSCYFL
jgi:hypothetical protein